jgi:hypothetical protein
MDPSQLANKLLETVTKHLPPDTEWMPLAIAGAATVVGLVFMVKGAKLAPVLAAIAFAGVGGFGGAFAAHTFNLPLWPVVIITGVLGLLLGVVLFRLWFALLVAGCLTVTALGVYGGQVLGPPLTEYQTRGLQVTEAGPEVTLPEPVTTGIQPWQNELTQLWAFLGERVPTFRASVYSITATAALAGLVFALLLPKAARAFWAATTGVLLFMPAVFTLLATFWSDGATRLQQWGLLITAVLWGISLLYNLADMLGWRAKKPAPPAGKPAPAAS